MSVYFVTWNLNNERSDYGQARREFVAQLEQYENVNEGGLESVRWISTSQTANEVSEFLSQTMDDNDRLFVSKLHSGHHQGWLQKTTWAWINARL